MAFGKKKAPAIPLTREQLVYRHRMAAENFLARSKKAGRIEACALHADQASAHATLALLYHMDTSYGVAPAVDVPEDDEFDDGTGEDETTEAEASSV